MHIVAETIGRIARPATFLPDPVTNDEIDALFNAARVAPSADNMQIWRFVMATDQTLRTKLAGALPEPRRQLFSSAPMLVAALADPWFMKGSRREQPFFLIDVPIAITHIV
ncbi:MAG: nitroreductase family protein, partial [Myxococcota bacterium]